MKKSKQPDRWERMASRIRHEHIASPYSKQIPMDCWETIEHRTVQAFRREHRAIVRMVRRQLSHSADWGYQEAIDDILAKLKARGK